MASTRYCTSTRVKLYGRVQEEATLKAALNRAISSRSRELVLIEGPSGAGKTSLVKQALRIESSCLVTRAIFTEKESSPFDCISNAMTNLIREIKADADLAMTLEGQFLQEFSQDEIDTLARIAPEIESLLNMHSKDHSSATSAGSVDADGTNLPDPTNDGLVHQVNALFRRFLRTITAEYPVVLCLFELHCADSTTLDLVQCIASDDELTQLVVIATYNDREISDDHAIALWKRKATARQNTSNQTTLITLSGLDLKSLNTFVAGELDLEEDETLSLAKLVLIRTNGIPFFVLQLLDHWQNEGLLSYDLNGCSHRWVWDTNKIQATALTENVVDLVSSRLHGHPPNVQRVLQLGACLGFEFRVETLSLLQEAFSEEAPLKVTEAIDFCVEERLLERMPDGHLMFFHQEIFHATILHLPQGDALEKLHLRIGLIFLDRLKSLRTSDDRLMYLCLDHISIGLRHLEDRSTKLELAKRYHQAGSMAIASSALASAAVYSKNGIDILDDLGNKWVEQHDLCMGLFINLSQTEYDLGRSDACLATIAELLSNFPDTTSKLQANLTRIRVFKASSNLKEFVDASFAFLNELGLSFPKKPGRNQAHSQLRRTKKKLDRAPTADLLGASVITDPSMATAVKVMNTMAIPLQVMKLHILAILVACRAVEICMAHGICKDSAEAFALFGIYCIAERDWLAEGYRLGELALEMSQKVDSTRIDPNVASFVYLMTKPWQLTPMSQCVNPMFDCHVEAMKREDPFMAFMIVNHYFALCFYSSLGLRPLLNDIERFSAQMLDYGQKLIFLQILPVWQCVLNLSGKSCNVLDVENGAARDRQHEVGNKNGVGREACWSYLMQLAVYMEDLDVASDMADKLKPINIGITKAHVFYPARIFFFGLIAIANARATTSWKKRKCRLDAAKYIAQMRSWINKKAANHVHKLLILEAEYACLLGKNEHFLQSKYDLAISTARKSGYIQDAALAAQLAAKALHGIDESRDYCSLYLTQAHEFWQLWGAHAVASKLAQDHPELNFSKPHRLGSAHLSKERYDPALSENHMRRLS